MRTTAHERTREFAAIAFVVAIFIGDIWLWKVTLPISVFVLPILAVLYPSNELSWLRNVPKGAYLLGLMLVVIGCQIAAGLSPWPKSDLAVWLPIIFGGVTLIVLRRVVLSEQRLAWAVIVGGISTGFIMTAAAMLLPPGTYLVPGQDAAQVEASYISRLTDETVIAPPPASPSAEGQIDLGQDRGPAVSTRESFATAMSTETAEFYRFKNRMRNLLGGSNYIAVFLVFCATVALFADRWLLSGLLAALAAMTLSRFGFGFLGFSFLIYLLVRRGYPKAVSIGSPGIIAAIALVGLTACSAHLGSIPGIESIATRLAYWELSWQLTLQYPILGSPRSFYMLKHNLTPTFNPHNSILFIALNFGVLGVLTYLAYVLMAMREIARAARNSFVWTGVLVGLLIAFLWSLVEIIVLTPAFEILLATMYSLAWASNRAQMEASRPSVT